MKNIIKAGTALLMLMIAVSCDQGTDPKPTPNPDPAPTAKNILVNGDMEAEDAGDWIAEGSELVFESGTGRNGSKGLKVVTSFDWGGTGQDIIEMYAPGKSYYLEGWFKTASTDVTVFNTASITVELQPTDAADYNSYIYGVSLSTNDGQYPGDGIEVDNSKWVQVAGVIKADDIASALAGKSLKGFVIYFKGGEDLVPYYLDDCKIVDLNPEITPLPVPTDDPVEDPKLAYTDLNTITDVTADLAATEYKISDAAGMSKLSELVAAGKTFANVKVYLEKNIAMNDDIAVLDQNFALDSANIDILLPFTPIGNKADGKSFSGTFDGNGKVISGLYIVADKSGAGLFGQIDGATIKNLFIEDAYVTALGTLDGNDDRLGGLVGLALGNSTIDRCAFIGNVGGGNKIEYVGGLVGRADKDTVIISNCVVGGIVNTSWQQVGGLVGRSYATISNCYTVVSVTGQDSAAVISKMSGGSVTNTYYMNTTEIVIPGVVSPLADAVCEVTVKTETELKALAVTLGTAFAADEEGGYPVVVPALAELQYEAK